MFSVENYRTGMLIQVYLLFSSRFHCLTHEGSERHASCLAHHYFSITRKNAAILHRLRGGGLSLIGGHNELNLLHNDV